MMARQMIGGQERQSGRTPWRAAGLCGERKALMATDICAGSGAEIIIKMKLQSRYGETIYK